MDTTNPPELAAAVGRRLQEIRGDWGVTQEQVAAVARKMGIPWERAGVAGLENGRRRLTAAELLALPYVLAVVHREHVGHNKNTAPNISLADLLPKKGEIDLAGWRVEAQSLRRLLGGNVRVVLDYKRHPRSDSADASIRGEAEAKAARALGWTEEQVDEYAEQLWGRTLTSERERRLRETAPEGASPRTLQAHRGNVTRGLLRELRAHWARRMGGEVKVVRG